MRRISRNRRVGPSWLVAMSAVAAAAACGSDDDPKGPASGNTGGQIAAAGSGGVLATGGAGGGPAGTGGATTSGGVTSGSGGVVGNTGGAIPATGGASAGGAVNTGGSGAAGGVSAGGAANTGGSGGGQTLPPVTDYSASGPFQTTSTPNQGPGNRYTIFRPDPLGENGFKHPPLIWGPGIATQVSNYTAFLTNVASHGFVIVAVNTLSSGPGAAANRTPMIEGLDWILAQNDASGIFQGKLDVRRAVSMGYSIGGTAAVQVGAHPSVITTVSIHGHSATAELHGPLLQTTGTNDTVGLPLQQQTYDASKVQTFLATLEGAGHLEILASGGGRERVPIVAWLRFWVYGDQGARKFFYGDDCTLCVAPWTNPQRKNWQ